MPAAPHRDAADAEALAVLDGIALVAGMYLNADYADDLMQARAHIAAVMADAERWIPISESKPPEDTPVWLHGRHGTFVGGLVYIDEGYAWTNCYHSVYQCLRDGKMVWAANDFEFDDAYDVTHWKPLPTDPAKDDAAITAMRGTTA